MEKPIDARKEVKVMTYDTLSQRIFATAQTKSYLTGDFIPAEVGLYWQIGQTLAWYAEELLESLAFDLRKQYGKSWYARDLANMVQLYLCHPTLEKLSGRCAGRTHDMSLDELLDVGK